MRIKEKIKKLGYFWLPSAPNRQVPGTLSISDGGKIELETIHRLGETRTPFGGGRKRVVGLIENDKIVTLDDCSYKSIKGSIGISKSLIRVNRAFTSVRYDEDEIPRFNSVKFSVEGIDEWVGITGFKEGFQREKETVSMSYQRPGDVSLNLNNGMQLLITFEWIPPGRISVRGARVSQKAYFKLISQEARKLNQFTSIAHKITTFLCFAMDQTVSLDGMSATSDNPRQDIGQDEMKMIPIDIYYPSWPYSTDEPDTNQSKLFEFKEIQNDAESIINNWIEAYEQIAPSFNLYFLAKMGMQTYLEERFMALVQGLEAYHRRTSNQKQMDGAEFKELIDNLIDQCPQERKEWLKGKLQYGNEVSLRHRLKSLIEPFKEIIGDQKKQKELISRIVNTRNYLTHYDQSLELEAAQGDALWSLYLKMELLFQLHFLHLIGFNREEIDSIVANCPQIQWKLR